MKWYFTSGSTLRKFLFLLWFSSRNKWFNKCKWKATEITRPSCYTLWHRNFCQAAVITARLAKRVKVMFLQACVTHSVERLGGGGGKVVINTNGQPPSPPDQVRMSTPYCPPRTRSEHLPPRTSQNIYPLPLSLDQVRMSTPSSPTGLGQNIYPPPWTRSECLTLPPLDQVRMSTPPPGTRLEHLPLPLWTRSECLPPPPCGPGQNVYPPQTTRRRAVRILLECILVTRVCLCFV